MRLPSRLSAVHRNVAGSIAASLGTQFALLLSGVAGARILGVLDRGRSALLLMFATILPLIATAGMPLSVTYWIAQNRRIGRRLVAGIRRILVIQTLAVVLVHACVLVLVFHGAPSGVQISAAVSLAAGPPILAWIYALAILQGTQQFRALNLCRMFFPPLNAAVLLGFLVTGVRGLLVVTIVWVTLYTLSALITVLAARRGLVQAAADDDGSPVPSTRTMSIFGLKALLGSVTPLEGFQLDQAIVGVFISQAALGIYVVAVAFTNLPRFVAQSIGMVAYPNVAANEDGQGPRRKIIAFTIMTLVLCGATVVVTELALPFLVPRLFGASFAPAVGVARILLISALLFGLRRVLSECARGAGRPALGSVAEAVSLALLVPCVLLFSGSGAKGVALALVVIGVAGVATVGVGLLVRPKWRLRPRRLDSLRPAMRQVSSLVLLAGAALCGVALGGAGLGPAAGAAAGVAVLVCAIALLRVSSDRAAYVAVAALVLAVTWNGVRIGSGALGDVFMLIAFVVVVGHVTVSRRAVPLPPWLLFTGAGFLLAALLAMIFPPSFSLVHKTLTEQANLVSQLGLPVAIPARSDLSALIKFELSLIVIPLLVAVVATSERRCARLLDLWTISAIVSAAVGVLDFSGVAHLAPTAIAGNRSAGLTIHPNYLALTCAMALPPALLWLGRSARSTAAGVLGVALLLGGEYASGSRAGAVGAVIAVALTVLLVPRLRVGLGFLLPLGGMGLLAVLLFTSTGRSVLHQIRLGSNSTTAGSDTQRGMDATVAFAQFKARPLEGVGFSVIADAHDIYLQLLAAGGLVALASFATFCGGLLGSARRALTGTQSDAVVAVAIAILVWLVNGIFDNQVADKYLYVLPGLLYAMSRVAVARQRRAVAEQAAVGAAAERVGLGVVPQAPPGYAPAPALAGAGAGAS